MALGFKKSVYICKCLYRPIPITIMHFVNLFTFWYRVPLMLGIYQIATRAGKNTDFVTWHTHTSSENDSR